MRHRTSAQTKSIEAEVQARRQVAYQAMLDKRHALICSWCGAVGEVAVTVEGDEQSPELCGDCTDQWDSGVRKRSHRNMA